MEAVADKPAIDSARKLACERTFIQLARMGNISFCRNPLHGLALFAIATLAVTDFAQASTSQEDLVVVGRLENLSYKLAKGSVDGLITARLHIKRVVHGRSPKKDLLVRYFAHTFMREDRDFQLRLRRGEGMTYLVCTEPPGPGIRCN